MVERGDPDPGYRRGSHVPLHRSGTCLTRLAGALPHLRSRCGRRSSSVPSGLIAGLLWLRRKQEAGADSPRKPDLHPKPPEPVADGEITAAIERGVAFLLKDQNVDGSWGSPERTKNLNIVAGIGSHHAFRTAVTALCVSALIEVSATGNKLARPGRGSACDRTGRGIPVPRAAPGPPRRSDADLQRLGPRLRHPGAGAHARPLAA